MRRRTVWSLLSTLAIGVVGGVIIGLLLDTPWAYGGALALGMAAGSLTSMIFPWRSRPEISLLCHENHGPDLGRVALHVPGYRPGDRDAFEARIVMLRETYPGFNEAAFRCMGPARYYEAVARERLRGRAEHESA